MNFQSHALRDLRDRTCSVMQHDIFVVSCSAYKTAPGKTHICVVEFGYIQYLFMLFFTFLGWTFFGFEFCTWVNRGIIYAQISLYWSNGGSVFSTRWMPSRLCFVVLMSSWPNVVFQQPSLEKPQIFIQKSSRCALFAFHVSHVDAW